MFISAQISDSNTVPGEEKIPTIFQFILPNLIRPPSSNPLKLLSNPFPTTISFVPGVNILPSEIAIFSLIIGPVSSMPLRGILAGVLLDFFIHRHTLHAYEQLPAFYALYGFLGCVILVLIAKEMRKVLMRKENYYDDVDH